MKKILLTLLVLLSFLLTGCAGMGGNDAYAAAHKSAADGRMAEANARAQSEQTLALAAASAAKGCESDLCRAMAMMTFGNMRSSASNLLQTAAPAIAAPVNEALEVFKEVGKTALGLYGIRINGALGLVNATKGAADIDATKAGIGALDLITTTTTPAK